MVTACWESLSMGPPGLGERGQPPQGTRLLSCVQTLFSHGLVQPASGLLRLILLQGCCAETPLPTCVPVSVCTGSGTGLIGSNRKGP